MNLTIAHIASTRRVVALAKELGEATKLSNAMGQEVRRLTVEHLLRLAVSRHATAERLGARPTGHLAQAAEKVAEPESLEVDGPSATLTINHVGMVRALRDVTITPSKKWLAIPVHAMAYARRPAEVWEPWRLFIVGRSVFMKREGQAPLRLWALVRSVTQKQDRRLLPSNEEFQKAAVAGAYSYLRETEK